MMFKVGDVVLLRSGGPAVTVYSVLENVLSYGPLIVAYECVWFSDGERKHDVFSEPELVRAVDQQEAVSADDHSSGKLGAAK